MGRAVQVDLMKPMLKAPETIRLKLKYYESVSNFAFNFNLRRYSWEIVYASLDWHPNYASLIVHYTFDEGSGTAAGDCTRPLLSFT